VLGDAHPPYLAAGCQAEKGRLVERKVLKGACAFLHGGRPRSGDRPTPVTAASARRRGPAGRLLKSPDLNQIIRRGAAIFL
jgi:hypothetical protein